MQINNITQNNINSSKFNNKTSFKGNIGIQLAQAFIKSQENLSSTRFIQDTVTNWCPKAIFSRSKEDFCEMSFLEFLESAIFYFASPIFGEKLFRNIFKNINSNNFKNEAKNINNLIPKSINEIAKDSTISTSLKNQAKATKAGIVLACTFIPVAEYVLSFAKNLFTLKTFKKSDFNNIANLDKETKGKENTQQQKKVETNAKKHLKRGAIISLSAIALGALLAKYGANSPKLQKAAEAILEPGKAIAGGLDKLGFNSDRAQKVKNTISKFSLDFENNNGKLALSKGQLGLTAVLGLFGYSKAAQDRGKLDVAEVWTRVPLVVFYTIFGSELFEKSFVKLLDKNNKFQDLLKKDSLGKITIPKLNELDNIAKEIASKNGTLAKDELNKLIKQKAFTTAIPYAFSLLFMGFTLSAITRLTTQLRYNHEKKQQKAKQNNNITFLSNKLPDVYKAFQK